MTVWYFELIQSWFFGQSYCSRIQVLQIAQFCVSFSHDRKSEMNVKHKIRTYVIHNISQGHVTFCEEVGIDSRKHAQDSLKTQKQRNK